MASSKPTHRKHLPLHDYRERCIYHITLVVSDRCKVFGRIVDRRQMAGDQTWVTQQHSWQKVMQQDGSTLFISPEGQQWTEAMMAATAKVELTPLGYDISKAIQSIPEEWGKKGIKAKILAKIVMPEHIHFILFIEEPMEERLQKLIRGWKQGCNKLLRKYLEGGGCGAGVKNAAQPNGRSENSAPANSNSSTGPRAMSAPANPNSSTGPRAISAPANSNSSTGPCPMSAPANPALATESCSRERLEKLPSGSAAFLRSAMGSSGSAAFLRSAMGSPPEDGAIACSPEDGAMASSPDKGAIPSFLQGASKRILEGHALFEDDFDETRLRRKGQLRAMIDYVHNNPTHRWLRAHKPHWLLPIRGIEIAGRCYDAIGNILLLGLPRFQVHCRYRWERDQDHEARRAHQNESVLKARKGYALVSPFISPHEAAVREFCLREGHSIIQISDNGFSDFSQCPGGLYDYCDRGQVLLLVPSERPHIDRKSGISRAECKALNDRAEEIAKEQ
ncbi:MAG: hypothetical protein MST03_02895 [Bacteroidales bacterium]|nr:hypothetical protein [Bacteroidales bacterium]